LAGLTESTALTMYMNFRSEPDAMKFVSIQESCDVVATLLEAAGRKSNQLVQGGDWPAGAAVQSNR
jgi:hypothetical protein